MGSHNCRKVFHHLGFSQRFLARWIRGRGRIGRTCATALAPGIHIGPIVGADVEYIIAPFQHSGEGTEAYVKGRPIAGYHQNTN
ncbi:hypothetical protein ES703_99675 [subsurface metagenome]